MSGLVYLVSARYWVLCARKFKESGVGSRVFRYWEMEGIRCLFSCIKYQSGIGKWKESGVCSRVLSISQVLGN